MISKKSTIVMLAVVLLSIHFSCTSGTKIFEQNPPFTIKETTFQNWFAGSQEFGRGIHIFLEFENIPQEVKLDSIYFRGMAEILQRDPENPLKYKGNLKASAKQDVVMDENPAKEMNNPIPDIQKDFPFDLSPKEAVISYRRNNKQYYHKIIDAKEIEALNYPSSNQGDN